MGLSLELPFHNPVARDPRERRDDAKATEVFMASLGALTRDVDIIVIDTPSGSHHLSVVAHGIADTLVTPVNDSFVDLDVIATIGPQDDDEPQPSCYADTVAMAGEGRRFLSVKPTDWVVVQNRLSSIPSRNQRQVSHVLSVMAPQFGFRTVRGLSERVVFREFFPAGLTAFDPMDEKMLGGKPSLSHMVARREVREMVQAIGLIPSFKDAEHAMRSAVAEAKEARLPRAKLLDTVGPSLTPSEAPS
jgi:chromosome partitioning protein